MKKKMIILMEQYITKKGQWWNNTKEKAPWELIKQIFTKKTIPSSITTTTSSSSPPSLSLSSPAIPLTYDIEFDKNYMRHYIGAWKEKEFREVNRNLGVGKNSKEDEDEDEDKKERKSKKHKIKKKLEKRKRIQEEFQCKIRNLLYNYVENVCKKKLYDASKAS